MSLELFPLKPYTKKMYAENWYELKKSRKYQSFLADTMEEDWEKFKRVAPHLGWQIVDEENPTPEIPPEWGEVCP